MHALDHKVPPPVVGALVAVLMGFLAQLPPPLLLPEEFRLGLLGAFLLAGIAFDILGLLAFRRSRTTINPLSPGKASALVTGGIYRISRNPMYAGMGLLLIAWAFYLASPWPFLGPVTYVLYISRFQIQPEERVLKELFGETYAAYAARVRRWL